MKKSDKEKQINLALLKRHVTVNDLSPSEYLHLMGTKEYTENHKEYREKFSSFSNDIPGFLSDSEKEQYENELAANEGPVRNSDLISSGVLFSTTFIISCILLFPLIIPLAGIVPFFLLMSEPKKKR